MLVKTYDIFNERYRFVSRHQEFGYQDLQDQVDAWGVPDYALPGGGNYPNEVNSTNPKTHKDIRPNPIEYRCQQQHIVLLTDGDPMGDIVGPILERDKTPLIDQREKLLSSRRYTSLKPYEMINEIDITSHGREMYGELSTSFVARYLWDLDLIKDAQNLGDTDKAGKEWDSEGSIRMPIHMNAITFGDDPNAGSLAELDRTVKPSGGVHVHAKNPDELYSAFHSIFQNIIQTRSGTGSVEDQNAQTAQSVRYTTSYEPRVWTGAIVARGYDPQTKSYTKHLWDTRDRIKQDQGLFVTAKKQNNGSWKTIDLRQANIMEDKYARWLQGEEDASQKLRDRQGNLLGSIINSDIYYFATDVPNINLNSISEKVRNGFIDYIVNRRDSMGVNYLITGSNDGLINFIVAEKNGLKNNKHRPGTRAVSYFPSFFANDIKEITSLLYDHKYKVDGTTHFFDALIDDKTDNDATKYVTLGITSMGAGARALVGYQVYEAKQDLSRNDAAFKVNFEITHKTSGFENLGYTYSEVDFINRIDPRTGKKQAVAIFGNGFGTNVSSIFLVDAKTGEKIEEIVLDEKGLGAASPALITSMSPKNGFQMLDSIYVGDYNGTLHKVTFAKTGEDLTQHETIVLFRAPAKHPITVRPLVMEHPVTKDKWIYFGTGSAKTEKDIDNASLKEKHYFYGMKDLNKLISIDSLEDQSIKSITGIDARKQLYTTSNVADPIAETGWKISLKHSFSNNGERVIRPAVFVGNKYVNFATWSVNRGDENDRCLSDTIFGSEMSLNLFNGNAGNPYGKSADHNGSHLDNDAFGRPTGETVTARNIYGGNFYSGYEYLKRLKSEYGSYPARAFEKNKETTTTTTDENGRTITVTLEHESTLEYTTELGNTYRDTVKDKDVFEDYEPFLNNGKRLYIKQRAI